MTALTETEDLLREERFDTLNTPILAPELWGAWGHIQGETQQRNEDTEVGCAKGLLRWYEGSSRPTLITVVPSPRKTRAAGALVSGNSLKDLEIMVAPRLTLMAGVPATHSWKLLPSEVYSRLFDLCWNETADWRDFGSTSCCRSAQVIAPQVAFEHESDTRLVPPVAPVRRIRVHLRSVGREQPRVHFDPDFD